MIQSAAQAMNIKSGDRYLFSGTATTQPPFVVATDADGNVTSVTNPLNQTVTTAYDGQGRVTQRTDEG